jgi:hypothetical protein
MALQTKTSGGLFAIKYHINTAGTESLGAQCPRPYIRGGLNYGRTAPNTVNSVYSHVAVSVDSAQNTDPARMIADLVKNQQVFAASVLSVLGITGLPTNAVTFENNADTATISGETHPYGYDCANIKFNPYASATTDFFTTLLNYARIYSYLFNNDEPSLVDVQSIVFTTLQEILSTATGSPDETSDICPTIPLIGAATANPADDTLTALGPLYYNSTSKTYYLVWKKIVNDSATMTTYPFKDTTGAPHDPFDIARSSYLTHKQYLVDTIKDITGIDILTNTDYNTWVSSTFIYNEGALTVETLDQFEDTGAADMYFCMKCNVGTSASRMAKFTYLASVLSTMKLINNVMVLAKVFDVIGSSTNNLYNGGGTYADYAYVGATKTTYATAPIDTV